MPVAKLTAVQVPDGTLSQKVDYLTNLMVQYKKELEYYINNLDDANVSGFTGSVITGLGSGYSDDEALAAWIASDYATYIDSSGVYTGTLTALQVNAVNIDADSITTGTLSASRISTDIAQVNNFLSIGGSAYDGAIWLTGSGFGSSNYACIKTVDAVAPITDGSLLIGSSDTIQIDSTWFDVYSKAYFDDDVEMYEDLDVGGDLTVDGTVSSDSLDDQYVQNMSGQNLRMQYYNGYLEVWDGSSFEGKVAFV